MSTKLWKVRQNKQEGTIILLKRLQQAAERKAATLPSTSVAQASGVAARTMERRSIHCFLLISSDPSNTFDVMHEYQNIQTATTAIHEYTVSGI